MKETPNHELNQFEQGDTDWEHSSDMATIEERLQIRDEEANLENYQPHEAATFIATDTGAVYDGDGEEWVGATRGYDGIGAKEATVESLRTEDQRSNRQTIGTSFDDPIAGPSLGANRRSYTDQFPQILNSIPTDRDKPIVVVYADRLDNRTDEKRAADEFSNRSLPWGAAIPTYGDEIDGEIDYTIECARKGCEIGLYSGSGGNWVEDIEDLDDLLEVGFEQKQTIEDAGFNCSWMAPRDKDGFDGGTNLDSVSLDTPQARAMESLFTVTAHSAYFGDWKTSGGPLVNVAPHIFSTPGDPGNAEDWTSDDVTDLLDGLDDAISAGANSVISYFVHPRKLHDEDNWDNFTDFLDGIEQRRNGGEIQVCTPSMAVSASRNPEEYDICIEGSPHSPDFSDSLWEYYQNPPSIDSGEEYYILGGAEDSGVWWRRPAFTTYFPAVMVEFEGRVEPDSGDDGRVRVELRNLDMKRDDRMWPNTEYPHLVTESWETYRQVFSFPRTGDYESGSPNIRIWGDVDEAHVKNIKIYPI